MNSLLVFSLLMYAAEEPPRQCVMLVVGADGAAEFADPFGQWAEDWRRAAEVADAEFVRVDDRTTGTPRDRERLKLAIQQRASLPGTLWLVLIGHGTYDGQQAKFNLRGPDVSAEEIAEWLSGRSGPTAIINCTSASAPFINQLSSENRVVVTATKSGYQLNFARFGQFLSRAITDASADLDKDDQVSLLEAFLAASSGVREYYATESRLATEHALIDDNGDSLGTPADWFRGVRATKRAQDGATLDGLRAHQLHLIRSQRELRMPSAARQRRDALEIDIAALRERKSNLPPDEYYARLETLMVELARLYASLDESTEATTSESSIAPAERADVRGE